MNNKNNKTKRKFSTVAEHLDHAKGLGNIFGLVHELNRITNLIQQNFPELAQICHCGAIDYANDLLVLFTGSNSAFYTVNNRAGQIQDFLAANGVNFHKLLVKVSPETANKPLRRKHQVGAAEHAMLAKFASAINRQDLLKPLEDDNEESLKAWEIEL